MLARKPKMLVGITLANKMTRQIWAMLAARTNPLMDPGCGFAQPGRFVQHVVGPAHAWFRRCHVASSERRST